jgi:RNA polymerase sigma factor (sigma-70 family)
VVRTQDDHNSFYVIKSFDPFADTYKRIDAHEEAQLVAKVIWLKKALHLRQHLSNMDDYSAWANVLGISTQQLLKLTKQAEIARGKLLAMGIRFSVLLAKRQFRQRSCEDLSDIVHEGIIVFFNAVESFDPGKGDRLSTYAYSRIRARLKDFSRHDDKRLKALELESLAVFDYFYETNEVDFEELIARVHQALKSLPKRQRLILEKKFGIRGEPQLVKDIANDFGVSYETIRKDQNAAISALSGNCSLKNLVA